MGSRGGSWGAAAVALLGMVFSWLVACRHFCLCIGGRGRAKPGQLWGSIGPLAPLKAMGLQSCCPGRAGQVLAGPRCGRGHQFDLAFGGEKSETGGTHGC